MLQQFYNHKCLLKQVYLQFAIDIFGINVLNRKSNRDLRDTFLLELDILVRKYDTFLMCPDNEWSVFLDKFLSGHDS